MPHGMEKYENGHHLAVGHTAGRLRRRLPEVSSVCFFNSGAKYLQNSSRIQKNSIKFASVMGMDVFM